jgi:hypothetical protein
MNSNKNLFALALILIGVLLIFQIFNVPFISEFNLGNIIGVLWPLFILIPGINMLRNRFNFGGLVVTLIGGSFLLENLLEIVGVNYRGSVIFKFFWPAVLIFIGYKILTQNREIHFDSDEPSYNEAYEQSNDSKSVGISFGSKKYIYTKDEMPDGISTLNLNISFGGAEIIVEDGIQVIMIGQYSLAGYEFFDSDGGGLHSEIKEARYGEHADFYDKTLIIKTNISFGGIEVRRR